MEKFHGIEFELPRDYLLVDKDNYLAFRNTTKGLIDSWLNEQTIQWISEGASALIFKEEKIEMVVIDSMERIMPKESIILTFGKMEHPNISEEEFLIALKNEHELTDQQLHQQLVKCEISNIFNFAKFSIYKKTISQDKVTSYIHEFFTSEGSGHRYSIQMNIGPLNDDSELSKKNFNKILNSIKIK